MKNILILKNFTKPAFFNNSLINNYCLYCLYLQISTNIITWLHSSSVCFITVEFKQIPKVNFEKMLFPIKYKRTILPLSSGV